MTYDPGRLALTLGDLAQELDRWNATASETLEDARHHQQLTLEAVRQVQHRAAILSHQAVADVRTCVELGTTADQLMARADEQADRARLLHENTGRLSEAASSTLDHWRHELAAAHSWHQRAMARLRQAETALEAAHRDLAAARRALSSAEADLRACQSYRDSEGRRRDCSGASRQVQQAGAWVSEAQDEVRRCEIEVDAARQEVAAAQARVDCSQRGVGEAELGVQLAVQASQAATESVDNAEWSSDYARTARQAADAAARIAAEESGLVDQVQSGVRIAAGQADAAGLANRRASQSGDQAQRDAGGGSRELTRRMDDLRRLDLPTL